MLQESDHDERVVDAGAYYASQAGGQWGVWFDHDDGTSESMLLVSPISSETHAEWVARVCARALNKGEGG